MIGKTISHYKILQKLGEGGMGVVYKAEDTKLKRKVALKFLPAELVRSKEFKERFLREAQAAGALAHPNICTVYEIDEADDQAFIAMEYVDGQSLEEKIETGPLNPNEALDIAIQIAEGLQEAHDLGIVHRDIKSANIIMSRRGQARILDFGLAKLAGRTRLTKTATIMGTVAYMSPEQAHGEAAIDHHTDIWSLGVVLYEMLSSRLPFDAPTDAGLVYKIVHEEPESLVNLRSEIPASLAQAALKMMQKEPRDRYENMAAVIADLKSIQSGVTPTIVVQDKTTPSIAVLPFVDMSPQKDQEYLCDGIAETLINELTRLEGLHVIARTSAFSFKNKDIGVREIGEKLDVSTMLEGSVQKVGNRLRIMTQFVDAKTGRHIWSEKYDREMDDIFAIQDEITLAIIDKLEPTLLTKKKAAIARRKTIDLEAYELYLRGRYFWNKRTEEDLKKAIECFKKAISKAPSYTLAYSGLADAYGDLPGHSSYPPKEAYLKAHEAALKALELDDTLAEAHTSLAFGKTFYEWDWEGAEREYKRAIELNPGYAPAHHFYAMYLMSMGRFDDALEEILQAHELDPLSLIINMWVGQMFSRVGQHDEGIEALKETIEMDPSFSFAHLNLGVAYLQKSMAEEALAEFEKERAVSGGSNLVVECAIGTIQALMGNRVEAQLVLDNLLENARDIYIPSSRLALLYLALGDNDRGFELLHKACEERDFWLFLLKTDPVFDILDLRSDARFISILKKMNLEP